MPTEDRDYHIDRARIELDLAYRTENFAAARSHFGLASLHMRRISEDSVRSAEPKSQSLAETLGAAMP